MSQSNLTKIKVDIREYSKEGELPFVISNLSDYIDIKEISMLIKSIKILPISQNYLKEKDLLIIKRKNNY